MHKKSTPGKKTGARSRARGATGPLPVGTDAKHATRRAGFSHIPPTAGEILFRGRLSQLNVGSANRRDSATPSTIESQSTPVTSSLSNAGRAADAAAAAAAEWLDWMRSGLPAELAPHVVQVLLKGKGLDGSERQLIVFADSPAWCARLRYALLALEQRVRTRDPAIARLSARVLRLD